MNVNQSGPPGQADHFQQASLPFDRWRQLRAIEKAKLPATVEVESWSKRPQRVAAKAMRAVLKCLDSHARRNPTCTLKIETIHQETNISEQHLARVLKALEQEYLIERKKRSGEGGRRAASVYRIIWSNLEALCPAGTFEDTPDPNSQGAPPTSHGACPDPHSAAPNPHCEGALNRPLEPCIEPPPPSPPQNRNEKSEAEAEENFEGLKAEDLVDLQSLLDAYPRLIARSDITDTEGDRASFVALCFAMKREQRAKAGTSEAFRSFLGLLNWRLRRPRIEWRNWITATDRERADRDLERIGTPEKSQKGIA